MTDVNKIVARATIAELWAKTEGRAWEPPQPRHPLVERLIHQGYARRVDGRCGFEAMKDAMLTWTEAGKAAACLFTEQLAREASGG